MSDRKVEASVQNGSWRRIVAADVSAYAANTWDGALRRDPRLLVPMDVRALVVPAAGGVTRVPTVTAPDPAAAEPWPLPPAPFQPPALRAPGVYLHFAMPDALTRGARQAAGASPARAGAALGLPALPDRFVVVRLAHGTSATRAWVIEADRALRTPLASWKEERGPRPDPPAGAPPLIPSAALTAAAGGDLAWAATVDAVLDRLALHDDLADLPAAARARAVLSYLVAGWWSRPDLDPMAGTASVAAYSARLESLGWTAPLPEARLIRPTAARDAARASAGFATADAEPGLLGTVGGVKVTTGTDLGLSGGAVHVSDLPLAPQQTLLHGAVMGVRADGEGPDLRPPAAALEIAVAGHPVAALAALLADGDAAGRLSAERLLTAFGASLLATIDQADGLSTVDEERHARGFLAAPGGTRLEPDRIGEGDPPGAPPPPGQVPATRTAGPGSAAASTRPTLEFTDRRTFRRARKERIEAELAHGTLRKPRTFRDVSVPLPRFHFPGDLSLLLRGAARSQRHGGDGRFDAQGRLACRLSPGVIRGYSGLLDAEDLPLGLRTLGSGAIPPEVDLLVREAVLTDPYRPAELAGWAAQRRALPAAQVRTRLEAEAALRYLAPGRPGDPALPPERVDALRRASIAEGEDASPVATQLWSQPWVPLWCEWELELRVDDARSGWTLGVTDLEPGEGAAAAPAAAPEVHAGRSLLSASSARALAADVRRWLAEEDQRDAAGQGQLAEDEEARLAAAATAAEGADLLAGAFEGIRERLLGLDPVTARMVRIEADGTPRSKPRPEGPPRLLAGGRARLSRLRLVDAFGRHLDAPVAALAAARVAADRVVPILPDFPSPAGAAELLLPPRFQCPARLMLRLVDAAAPDGTRAEESRVNQERPDLSRSPVAGFVLPDHVDEALELFDATGEPLGQLMHDPLTGVVLWEGAPGTPGPLGAPPQGGHPAAKHLARLAVGMVAADARARAGAPAPGESALSALLRAIDTTLWTIDPFGSTGTGALAALVGRPVAVVRATLSLELGSDLAALEFASPADRELRRRAFEEAAARAVHVRLGEVTRTDDGLLAYAVDDAYDVLRTISPEVRLAARESGPGQGHFRAFGQASRGAPAPSALSHPYLDFTGALELHAGQLVRLTLLLVPGTAVSATSGLLPRKRIALARDWVQEALERLSPSFRVGPVLLESTSEGVRLPRVAALGPDQRFTHKPDPLGWRDDPILAATQTAYLPDQPAGVREGWIRVSPPAAPSSGPAAAGAEGATP